MKKYLILLATVICLFRMGDCNAFFYQPFQPDIVVTCLECNYTYVPEVNVFNLKEIVGWNLPNSLIKYYLNKYENCPQCGKKNWTVESVLILH